MPALTPAVGSAWLTLDQENANVGQAVNEAYPGPITTDHAGGSETVTGRDPDGGQGTNPLPPDGVDGVSDGGGGYWEQPYSGHAGVIAPFDASARPFAPPGVIPDTHSYDTGDVERHGKVLMPSMFGWFRRVLQSATFDSNAYSYTSEGFKVNTAIGRNALDQYEGQDADAYDPFPVDYSERPLYANLAYEPNALTGSLTAYSPSGELMDMTPTGGQGNNLYNEPADPAVNGQVQANPGSPGDFDGGDF